MPSTPPLAYVVAGSEATGGAGIQADLKTFQQLGAYGVGTLTCIVSFDPKNDWGHRFVPVDPQVIADQIEAATATHDLDVVKIGMLARPRRWTSWRGPSRLSRGGTSCSTRC